MQSSTREVLRCLLEGVRFLAGPDAEIIPACKVGISQARTRLGVEPLQQLYETVVHPIATPATPGVWYGEHGQRWRVMCLDGTTLDVADTAANVAAFRRPGSHSSPSAYPHVRLSAVAEARRTVGGTRSSTTKESLVRCIDTRNEPSSNRVT